MSILRKFRKNVQKTVLRFDPEMYTNTLGSLIITHYILSELDGDNMNVVEIKKKWKQIKKKSIDFWLDDPDFIVKALKLFNMEPQYGRFCMAQSRYNTLFVPYLNETPLPIREDGLYPRTVLTGKIYPVKEEEPINETNERDKE